MLDRPTLSWRITNGDRLVVRSTAGMGGVGPCPRGSQSAGQPWGYWTTGGNAWKRPNRGHWVEWWTKRWEKGQRGSNSPERPPIRGSPRQDSRLQSIPSTDKTNIPWAARRRLRKFTKVSLIGKPNQKQDARSSPPSSRTRPRPPSSAGEARQTGTSHPPPRRRAAGTPPTGPGSCGSRQPPPH